MTSKQTTIAIYNGGRGDIGDLEYLKGAKVVGDETKGSSGKCYTGFKSVKHFQHFGDRKSVV